MLDKTLKEVIQRETRAREREMTPPRHQRRRVSSPPRRSSKRAAEEPSSGSDEEPAHVARRLASPSPDRGDDPATEGDHLHGIFNVDAKHGSIEVEIATATEEEAAALQDPIIK